MKWLPQHPIKRFVLLFTGIYSLLLIAVFLFNMDEGYSGFYRWMGEKTFKDFRKNGVVLFKEGDDPLNKGLSTMLILVNRDQYAQALKNNTNVATKKIYTDPWRSGLLSTTLLIALIMASPVPIKRKLIVLGVGLLLVTLFVMFRQWITILNGFNESDTLEVVKLGAFGTGLLKAVERVTVGNVVFSAIFPVFIWVLVTFGKEDWKVLQGIIGTKGQGSDQPVL